MTRVTEKFRPKLPAIAWTATSSGAWSSRPRTTTGSWTCPGSHWRLARLRHHHDDHRSLRRRADGTGAWRRRGGVHGAVRPPPGRGPPAGVDVPAASAIPTSWSTAPSSGCWARSRRGCGPTESFRAYLFVTLRRLAAEQGEQARRPVPRRGARAGRRRGRLPGARPGRPGADHPGVRVAARALAGGAVAHRGRGPPAQASWPACSACRPTPRRPWPTGPGRSCARPTSRPTCWPRRRPTTSPTAPSSAPTCATGCPSGTRGGREPPRGVRVVPGARGRARGRQPHAGPGRAAPVPPGRRPRWAAVPWVGPRAAAPRPRAAGVGGLRQDHAAWRRTSAAPPPSPPWSPAWPGWARVVAREDGSVDPASRRGRHRLDSRRRTATTDRGDDSGDDGETAATRCSATTTSPSARSTTSGGLFGFDSEFGRRLRVGDLDPGSSSASRGHGRPLASRSRRPGTPPCGAADSRDR